jgi:hypothetical protein
MLLSLVGYRLVTSEMTSLLLSLTSDLDLDFGGIGGWVECVGVLEMVFPMGIGWVGEMTTWDLQSSVVGTGKS